MRVACARSYASLYQKPPGGERTPEEDAAFKRALQVMADVYASAVGTTVLQVKEIPPRPKEFDGALCLLGLEDGKDAAAIRAAFGHSGHSGDESVGVELRSGMAVVRFTTHDAALAAKRAGPPAGLCAGLDAEYNERSYDGRRSDASGRDDDDGRGWCARLLFDSCRHVALTTSIVCAVAGAVSRMA